MERKDSINSQAREYFIINEIFNDIELDVLEESGHDIEYLAHQSAALFDGGMEKEEVRKYFTDAYPEAFTSNVVIPTMGNDIGEFIPHFLWNPYVPLDDFSVLIAKGGTGKTFMSCWLAAQVTRGGFIKADRDFWSQEEAKRTGVYPEPENVLYISGEEDDALLKDRFVKCGGDLSHFAVLDRTKSEGLNFTEGYLQFLLSVKSVNPRLVIIDPLQAYIGQKVDMNRTNQTRPAMQKLASIAKKCNCGIILISHENKGRHDQNINDAASGSTDIINASRSAMIMIRDPEDDDCRIMVHTKANYSALADSLKFRITPGGGFEFVGISQIDKEMLERAAQERKSVGDILAARDELTGIEEDLIEAICSYAVEGKSVIVTYDQFKDDFGAGIFGSSGRPSIVLKHLKNQLKTKGITLELKTTNGNAKRAPYNGKNRNGIEIFMEKGRGLA